MKQHDARRGQVVRRPPRGPQQTVLPPSLDTEGKRRWRELIEGRLEVCRLTQKQIDLDGLAASSAAREMSLIVGGSEEALKRLFDKPNRVEGLEDQLEVPRGKLLADLQRCAAPEAIELGWHPSFPTVPADEVEIPSPFGLIPSAFRSNDTATLDGVLQASRDAVAPWCVWVQGGPGTGARTLAEQIAKHLGLQDFVAVEPAIGWSAWRTRLLGKAVALLPRRVDRPHKDLIVLPEPWTDREVLAVVERLGACGRLSRDRVARLEEVAHALRGHPELLGPNRWPRSVIATLAAYAYGEVPETAAAARTRALDVAWELARSRPGAERLTLVGSSFLGRFWRGRWLSSAADWTRMTVADARALVTELMPVADARRAQELIAELRVENKEKHRKPKLDELAALLTGAPGDIVESLVAGGLLVRDGEDLVADDATTARVWVARALGPKPSEDLLRVPERTIDEDFGELATELAHAGANAADVLGTIARVPVEFAIDLAFGLMEYFAALPPAMIAPADEPHLIAAWATALWGARRDPFGHRWKGAIGGPFVEAARKLSRELRGRLPQLNGPDFCVSLDAYVPTRVIEAFGAPAEPDEDLRFRSSDLMYRAPYQTIAWTDAERLFGYTHERRSDDRNAVVTWIEELARGGNAKARALLTGDNILPDSSRRTWEDLPIEVRWRWLGRGENRAPWELWDSLTYADTLTHPAGALEALARFPRAEVEERYLELLGLSADFEPGISAGPRLVSRALEAAVELRLVRVLDVLAARPYDSRRPSTDKPWEELATVWAQAVTAAGALHSLGYPQALRKLWRRPVAPDLAAFLQRREVCAGSAQGALAQGFPLAEARAWMEQEARATGWSVEDARGGARWARGFKPARPTRPWLHEGEIGVDEGDVDVALFFLIRPEIEPPDIVTAWLRTQTERVHLGQAPEDAECDERRQAGLALVERDDETLLETHFQELDTAVWKAMLASAAWRERLWRRVGTLPALLFAVPKDGSPAWFRDSLAAKPPAERALFMAGRVAADADVRRMLEDAWRSALADGRVREAGMWAAVAANDDCWPCELVAETLRRWVLDEAEPFEGPAWFGTEDETDPFAGGWASLFNLLEAWPDRQKPIEPWLQDGIVRLRTKAPATHTSRAYGSDTLNFRHPHEPYLADAIYELAKAVDARSLCDAYWSETESEWRRDELVAWRLRGLDALELERLLTTEPWAPYAARRLVDMGRDVGRSWLRARLPSTIAEARPSAIWDMIKACLPDDAIARIETLVAAEPSLSKRLDFVSTHLGWGSHPKVRSHCERLQRRVFAPSSARPPT